MPLPVVRSINSPESQIDVLSRVEEMRPLFVEFIGPSGAGKTTVANEAAKILVSRGYRAARHPRLVSGTASRLWHSLRFFWFRTINLRMRVIGLMYALSVRPLRLSRRHFVRQLLFRAYYQREMKASDYQVVILCQSVVQTAWSTTFYGGELHRNWLDRLFTHIYREVKGTMAFIFLHLDPSTAAERVVKRAASIGRLDALPFEEVERWLAIHEETFQILTDSACRSTAAPIRYLDGTRPVSENAGRVADFVEAILRASQKAEEHRGERPRSSTHGSPDPAAELPA